MEIGNGNIASVRLAAIFVRMGTLVTDTVQIGKAIRFLKCEQVKMRSSTSMVVAEVAATIIFRLIVGVVCDILGARRGLAFLLVLACPGIVGMMSAA